MRMLSSVTLLRYNVNVLVSLEQASVTSVIAVIRTPVLVRILVCKRRGERRGKTLCSLQNVFLQDFEGYYQNKCITDKKACKRASVFSPMLILSHYFEADPGADVGV